jgi:hypothetical protein
MNGIWNTAHATALQQVTHAPIADKMQAAAMTIASALTPIAMASPARMSAASAVRRASAARRRQSAASFCRPAQ